MTTIKHLTDAQILEAAATRAGKPAMKESGECFTVQAVQVYIEGDFARVESVADIAVYAEESDALATAARFTERADDSCSTLKHMYTVSHRWVEL